jgi:hypothetical protein
MGYRNSHDIPDAEPKFGQKGLKNSDFRAENPKYAVCEITLTILKPDRLKLRTLKPAHYGD